MLYFLVLVDESERLSDLELDGFVFCLPTNASFEECSASAARGSKPRQFRALVDKSLHLTLVADSCRTGHF